MTDSYLTDSHLNWGILSTGKIARTFAKGVQESRTGRLAAVGSRDQESADTFGQEFDIPNRHATYESLLADSTVQAVYIATPHPLHARWAIAAAEAGKHILCEKPLTLNAAEAMSVVEAARQNGVILMEAFMYRCHPQTAKLAELIRQGAIGQVRVIHATFAFRSGFNPDSRLWNNGLGGGGILDVGCYTMSMSRLIAGAAKGRDFAEPLQIKGAGRIGETGVDEYALGVIGFEGDIVAQLSTGIGVAQDNMVRVFGTEGHIVVPSPWFCNPGDGPHLVLQQGKDKQEIRVEADRSLYAYEADLFAQSVQSGQVQFPAQGPEDALGNMKALDAWRQAVGVVYDAEAPQNHRPVRGELKKQAGAPMIYGRVAGVERPIARLIMGCDNQQTFPHGAAMWDDYFEAGGNCFDTGYIYGGGLQERLLGQWIQARGLRDQVVVIGKGAHTPANNPTDLTRQLHQSLERLQVEGVDIYLMHRDNPDIPAGEFVEVLNEHTRAGRIKVFGGSNWSLDRVQEANDYAAQKGLQGFGAVSNNFSLARMVDPVWKGCISASDKASCEWLTERQMPLFSWSSQARGFFVRGARDFLADPELVRCWYADDNFQRLERAQELARRKNTTPINIAAAYVLSQDFPTFALIGPRQISETHSSLPSLQVTLSAHERAWLNLETEVLSAE